MSENNPQLEESQLANIKGTNFGQKKITAIKIGGVEILKAYIGQVIYYIKDRTKKLLDHTHGGLHAFTHEELTQYTHAQLHRLGVEEEEEGISLLGMMARYNEQEKQLELNNVPDNAFQYDNEGQLTMILN